MDGIERPLSGNASVSSSSTPVIEENRCATGDVDIDRGHSSDALENTIKVTINTLMGGAFLLEVDPMTSVRQVKDILCQMQGIPITQQNLVFRRTALADDVLLSRSGVTDGSSLSLVLGVNSALTNVVSPPDAYASSSEHDGTAEVIDLDTMDILDITGMSEAEQDEMLVLLFGQSPEYEEFSPGFILCRDGDKTSMVHLGSTKVFGFGGRKDNIDGSQDRGQTPTSDASSLQQRLQKLQENTRHRIRMTELQIKAQQRKDRKHMRRVLSKERESSRETDQNANSTATNTRHRSGEAESIGRNNKLPSLTNPGLSHTLPQPTVRRSLRRIVDPHMRPQRPSHTHTPPVRRSSRLLERRHAKGDEEELPRPITHTRAETPPRRESHRTQENSVISFSGLSPRAPVRGLAPQSPASTPRGARRVGRSLSATTVRRSLAPDLFGVDRSSRSSCEDSMSEEDPSIVSGTGIRCQPRVGGSQIGYRAEIQNTGEDEDCCGFGSTRDDNDLSSCKGYGRQQCACPRIGSRSHGTGHRVRESRPSITNSSSAGVPSPGPHAVAVPNTKVVLPSIHRPGAVRKNICDDGSDLDTRGRLTEAPAPARVVERCAQCRRKLKITSTYRCRCGGVFCASHRHAEVHMCSYDYKTQGRQLLAAAATKVEPAKLRKV